jgi:hypothetical protein
MVRDNGVGDDYKIPYSMALTLMVFMSIAVYNVIELTLMIFLTFKRRNGLYFWSLLVATYGIVLYTFGFFFKFYDIPVPSMFFLTLIAIGWWGMVTGQSVVLYSRLHLIYRSSADRGRWVLYMIIFNAIICHIPTTVLTYGSNSTHSEPYLRPYMIYEKFQVTVFFIQEVIISGLYVYKTAQILRSEGSIRGRNGRTVMNHLIWVNVMVIVLDITLISLEYADFYNVQIVYKAAVYSVKLKMEFSILNRLLDLFQGRITDTSEDPGRSQHRTQHHLSTYNRAGGNTATVNGGISAGGPNSAYVRMEDDGGGIKVKDMEVIKTTEVRIERSKVFPTGSEGGDVESVASTRGEGVRRASSTSSSEAHIVRY